jgi:hypothetical protein
MKATSKNHGFSYLGSVNSSSKIQKTDKVLDIDTYVMYLAPSNLSGHNTCAMATKECISGCLNTSGRAKMDGSFKTIMAARIAKTKYFFDQRENFNSILFHEIGLASKRTENKGKQFAVRLNGTSDLNPILFKKDGKNILETYKDVQFYDYTKILNRIEVAKKHPNYDLTFSFTGYNWSDCAIALQNNVRVAVIFNVGRNEPLPETFNGYRVVDGDKYDYRPLDSKDVIVGLRWKSIRDKQANNEIKNSPFVVQVKDGQAIAPVLATVQCTK